MRAVLPSRAAQVKTARINGDRYNFRAKIVPVPISGQAGFSFTELLLVVTIMGIVAAVAIPDSSPTDPYKLEIAGAEFASAMRFAREQSIRTGQPHGFEITPTDKRLRVFRADTGTVPATPVYDQYHPVTKKLYDIDLDTLPFVGAADVANTTSYQGTCTTPMRVQFDAAGRAWCGDPATVLLRTMDVALTHGNHTETVTLRGVSGRVAQ